MKTVAALLFFVANSSLYGCPTCIGLPRPHERPFFERKSFVAALQEQKAAPKKSIVAPAVPPQQKS